jgi:hypothetical protein
MYWHGGERSEQSWSLPHVPGTRFGGSKPLSVLSSDTTFSAAEELTYDLQQLGRAVVIGERTRGGAHPCKGWTVHPHLEATVPVGRAINPISNTTGKAPVCSPDIPCPAADSLGHAHALALARLTQSAAHRQHCTPGWVRFPGPWEHPPRISPRYRPKTPGHKGAGGSAGPHRRAFASPI